MLVPVRLVGAPHDGSGKASRYFFVTSKDSMKLSRTFCFALVVMACVIVSTSGCDRRPQPYAGIPLDKGAEPINPESNNK